MAGEGCCKQNGDAYGHRVPEQLDQARVACLVAGKHCWKIAWAFLWICLPASAFPPQVLPGPMVEAFWSTAPQALASLLLSPAIIYCSLPKIV